MCHLHHCGSGENKAEFQSLGAVLALAQAHSERAEPWGCRVLGNTNAGWLSSGERHRHGTACTDKLSPDTALLQDIKQQPHKTQGPLAALIISSEELQFLSLWNNNWGLVLPLCYWEALVISPSDRNLVLGRWSTS